MKNRYKCFTLAEVLITLGIIGIIAAMTLPALLAKWQKHITVNKIKKFYSSMNQVLECAKADNGDYNGWHSDNSKDFYLTYIKPYLNKVESEQYNIHIYGGFTGGVRFVFADGTQGIFALGSNFTFRPGPGGTREYDPVIVFYPNAKKYIGATDKDNKINHPTRERFYFIINNKGALVTPKMEYTRTKNLENCKKDNTHASWGTNSSNIECSTVIFKDGWEIRDDYPW